MTAPGYVLWEGPSRLTPGVAVVVVLTLGSHNRKTGDMDQTWILLRDVHPLTAVRRRLDDAICGDCRHRGTSPKGRSCYVQVAWRPASVWRRYRRGDYPRVPPSVWSRAVAGRFVRLGAYGDPAAAPPLLWQALAGACKGWTGYTHQWAGAPGVGLEGVCMASTDDVRETLLAHRTGWRTFRVADEGYRGVAPGEIVCPASAEAGHRTHCDACRLCSGSRGLGDARADIVIQPHGQWAARFYRHAQEALPLGAPVSPARAAPPG